MAVPKGPFCVHCWGDKHTKTDPETAVKLVQALAERDELQLRVETLLADHATHVAALQTRLYLLEEQLYLAEQVSSNLEIAQSPPI